MSDGPRRRLPLAVSLAGLASALLVGCAPRAAPLEPSPVSPPAEIRTAESRGIDPLIPARVELGRRLFYDPRLSLNQTQACASCHRQALAFSDGRVHPIGSTGQRHRRNTLALANLARETNLTWANSLLPSLEQQALVPMFGDSPIELGLAGREAVVLHRLSEDDDYVALFARAFPGSGAPFTVANVTQALACFERALVSADSPFDRYLRHDRDALSGAARLGLALFRSETLGCSRCHGGMTFMEADPEVVRVEGNFHNTGLYNLDGAGAYPADDPGLMEQTAKPSDMGRFRTPSLRNVALTAPYMHDGSIRTLREVVDHYAAGGRAAENGGRPSPLRSPFVRRFELTSDDRADLVAFLEALTDESFVSDPRYADPFVEQ